MNPKGVANILKVLDQADSTDINEGRVAYFRYKEVLTRLAAFYGYPLELAVAVFAALSPNSDYLKNLRSTASVLDGHRRGVPASLIRVATYNHCRDRAYNYLNGVSFISTVKGKKILNFYTCILNPLHPTAVTIDGHAVNIHNGTLVALKGVAAKQFNYREVADAYREAARRVKLLPNQVQSITWFAHKRIHDIYYVTPFTLIENAPGDLWRTIQNPEQIKPYPLLSEALTIAQTRAPKPQNLASPGKQNPLFSIK